MLNILKVVQFDSKQMWLLKFTKYDKKDDNSP